MRVLVVEDEVRQAESLERGLRAEGMAVDIAHTGTDGLWMATENDYDAIILAVMLPGLNGFRVCSELRSRQVQTPILMLTAKDGELDEAEALDTVDERVAELTPREFAVLEYLLRRSGEIVPKRVIVEHVWDFAFDGDDNVVEVHVSALRRKLGADTIETVRGGGYRMARHAP